MANIKEYVIQPFIYENKNIIYDNLSNKVYNNMFASIEDIVKIKVDMVDIYGVDHIYNFYDKGKLHFYYEDIDIPSFVFDLDNNFEALIELANFKIGMYYIRVFVYNEHGNQSFSSSEIELEIRR